MRVTFLVPSPRRPNGGTLAVYGFAEALGRRGHRVHLAHGPGFPDPIRSVDEIRWFRFSSAVTHSVHSVLDPADLPAADAIEISGEVYFTEGPVVRGLIDGRLGRLGRPFVFVQASGFLPPAAEARAFGGPWPKVCVAGWLVSALEAAGVPAREIAYVPNGLDHGLFRDRVPSAQRPQQVAMLYNEHPGKGAPDGITALLAARVRRPDLGVVCFASKPPTRVLPDDFAFVEMPVGRDLVDGIYNRSRIFLNPARNEGFGLCPIEAMACGCALVTTDNGGSRDYARDGETALVVPAGDPEAMAAAVVRLLDDEALRDRIAAAGRDYVRRFDWDTSGAQLERVLADYLAN